MGVTARLLSPAEFGLIAMANVVLRLGAYVARMGLGRALIQRMDIDATDIRAAFTSSVAFGAIVASAIALSAPIVASYFQEPNVEPVVRWLSLVFVVNGLGATAKALMQRERRFQTLSIIEVASYVIGFATPAISLAAAGFGVWSLVVGALGQPLVAALLEYIAIRHAVVPTFDGPSHARLLRFGSKVSLISLLEFFGGVLDTLFIGRFGSTMELGLYNRAHLLSSLPAYRLNDGIARVLFPVLAAGRGDPQEFSATLHRSSNIAARLVIPIGIGMSIASPELVGVVLGKQWTGATGVVAILAPAMSIGLLSNFPGLALEALGSLRGKALVQTAVLISTAGILLLTNLVVPFDLLWVSLIIGLANLGQVFGYFALARSAGALSGTHLRHITGTVVGTSATTLVFVGGSVTLARIAGSDDLMTLGLAIVSGVVTLAALFRPTTKR